MFCKRLRSYRILIGQGRVQDMIFKLNQDYVNLNKREQSDINDYIMSKTNHFDLKAK